MHDLDSDMMKGIESLAGWIDQKAQQILDEVEEGGQRYGTVNKIIRDARKEIMPLRKKTLDALSNL